MPLSTADELIQRGYLYGNASRFQALMQSAYSFIRTTDAEAQFSAPIINALIFDSSDGASPDGTSLIMNLMEASELMVAQCVYLANASNAVLADDTTPAVRFFFINCISGGNVHEVGAGQQTAVSRCRPELFLGKYWRGVGGGLVVL